MPCHQKEYPAINLKIIHRISLEMGKNDSLAMDQFECAVRAIYKWWCEVECRVPATFVAAHFLSSCYFCKCFSISLLMDYSFTMLSVRSTMRGGPNVGFLLVLDSVFKPIISLTFWGLFSITFTNQKWFN